ncbi:hypothetical protein GUJ93_ZPchr0003g18352 [Zizania palustris]|uniref:Uncharacterized protein n=1 Tax=Zizania palustris TaxID=103762 RepID=A0A8J5VK70_ZIZPA|nr:hypothetical protein GUJ93_ZPchr0003g18352 [Zizania palustris]
MVRATSSTTCTRPTVGSSVRHPHAIHSRHNRNPDRWPVYVVATTDDDVLNALFDACPWSFDVCLLLHDSWCAILAVLDIYLHLQLTFFTGDPCMLLHVEDKGMRDGCHSHLEKKGITCSAVSTLRHKEGQDGTPCIY